MSLAWLKASRALWNRRRAYRKRKHTFYHYHSKRPDAERTRLATKWHNLEDEAAAMVARRDKQIAAKQPSYTITTNGGARGIVDQAYAIARRAGGSKVYVGSSFRPGDRVGSGNRSDHSGNDSYRAARDIGKQGTNLLSGPPSPELDRGIVAIGKAFGRNYGDGRGTVIDTFYWRGFRVQIIYRTPAYGDHRGHIHVGVRGA